MVMFVYVLFLLKIMQNSHQSWQMWQEYSFRYVEGHVYVRLPIEKNRLWGAKFDTTLAHEV